MRIYLESNFMLLGSETIESIDFDRLDVTLKELLEALSRRSADSLEFLRSDGKDLSLDWDIEVNGRSFGLYDGGLEAHLKDGDTVAIKLALLGGG
jgi:molybdopterin converting factor small subunit